MNKNITKLLSVMLVAVMIVLMIPFATSAASDAEQITSLDQLTTGKYVIVATNGYAMSTISGNWVLSQKVTPANNKLTGVADSIVWTITVNGTSVKLTDSKGATLKKGSKNYVATGDFTWTVVFDNGAFRFSTVSGSDTYYLASNIKSDSKIRNYKQSTLTGSYKADYAYAFNLYKVGGTGSTPVETTPVTTTPVTTAPETTVAAPETTVAAPETTVAAPETTVAAPETTVAAPETTVAAPETTVAAPETTVAAPETTVAAPETTAPSNPSTGDASFVIIAMAALAGVAVAFIVSKKKVRA